MNEQFHTTVLIPGPWKPQLWSVQDLDIPMELRENYSFLLLLALKSKISFRTNVVHDWSQEDYSDHFASLFPKETQNKLPLPIHSVFVIEAEGGSFQQLEQLCDAISEVLKIGGYGVKVPNSGKTITREEWEEFSFCPKTFFNLFVSIYDTGNGGILTCGMSNFGQRDVFVPLTYDEQGIDFIVFFAWFVVHDQPVIKDRETFARSENSPPFRIFEADDDIREADHPFYNPYGLWKVWPLEWLNE